MGDIYSQSITKRNHILGTNLDTYNSIQHRLKNAFTSGVVDPTVNTVSSGDSTMFHNMEEVFYTENRYLSFFYVQRKPDSAQSIHSSTHTVNTQKMVPKRSSDQR